MAIKNWVVAFVAVCLASGAYAGIETCQFDLVTPERTRTVDISPSLFDLMQTEGLLSSVRAAIAAEVAEEVGDNHAPGYWQINVIPRGSILGVPYMGPPQPWCAEVEEGETLEEAVLDESAADDANQQSDGGNDSGSGAGPDLGGPEPGGSNGGGGTGAGGGGYPGGGGGTGGAGACDVTATADEVILTCRLE